MGVSATIEPECSQRLARRCAWCGRTPIDGVWIDEGKQFAAHEETHGICPDCFDEQERRRRASHREARLAPSDLIVN
jgi:hypothetical protein